MSWLHHCVTKKANKVAPYLTIVTFSESQFSPEKVHQSLPPRELSTLSPHRSPWSAPSQAEQYHQLHHRDQHHRMGRDLLQSPHHHVIYARITRRLTLLQHSCACVCNGKGHARPWRRINTSPNKRSRQQRGGFERRVLKKKTCKNDQKKWNVLGKYDLGFLNGFGLRRALHPPPPSRPVYDRNRIAQSLGPCIIHAFARPYQRCVYGSRLGSDCLGQLDKIFQWRVEFVTKRIRRKQQQYRSDEERWKMGKCWIDCLKLLGWIRVHLMVSKIVGYWRTRYNKELAR